eukprot:TRINITY_DN63385_c0_g1_i3.p2 TRINITY_DN63385_c0_g1~~TRINITY_DN63385_c0_g1_i3.p2  ORF type:complete len:313 (+),score=34.23 TRINITY_DN63385_c0_g1_i3:105-1043(+)
MNLTPADKKRFKQHMDAKYLPQYVHSIPAPPDICEAVENLLKPRVLDLLPLSDSQKTSDNDMLARMLISTDFDLDETEAKLRRYLKWREQDRIDGIFQETIPPDILHPLTGGFCGHDNEGHPMYYGYWPPTHILMPLLKKYTVMDLLRSHFLLMERQREACIVDNQPQVSVVTDFSKAGLGILYHWGAVKAIKEMMLYDDKYYPEHMRHCFLVARVKAKMHIIHKDRQAQELSKWIPLDQIPIEWGGTSPQFARIDDPAYKAGVYPSQRQPAWQDGITPTEQLDAEPPVKREPQHPCRGPHPRWWHWHKWFC